MAEAVQPGPTCAPASPTAGGADALVGRTLGDFFVVRRLGQGGMGQVFLADQLSLKRRVALKFLRPEHLANQIALKRFQAEEIDHLKDRVAALRGGDDDAVIDAIVRHGWLRPGTRIDQKRMVQLARLSVLPLVDHRPFTYTREYITETIDAMFNIDGPYGDVIRQMTLPRNQLMLTRIHLGLGGQEIDVGDEFH